LGRTGNFARFANGGGQSDIREEVGALVVSAVRVTPRQHGLSLASLVGNRVGFKSIFAIDFRLHFDCLS
jgi:hypothetical protein